MSRLLFFPSLIASASVFAAPVSLGKTPPPPLADLAELRGVAPAGLKKPIATLRARLGEIADDAERAAASAALDTIEVNPTDAETILGKHAEYLKELRERRPQVLFLVGLAECKTDAEVVEYVKLTGIDVEKIGDISLRSLVRLTLAKLSDHPGDRAEIFKDHMRSLGRRFYAAAAASSEGNDMRTALGSIQIAVRCAPDFVPARLLFARLLESVLKDPEKAVDTLRVGLAHLAIDAPEAPEYLRRYFGLLELRERDAEVVREASSLLGEGAKLIGAKPPEAVRIVVATHLSGALYFTGRAAEALKVIDANRLDAGVPGLVLKAKCLFALRRAGEAEKLLEDALDGKKGPERDAILSQRQRFFIEEAKYAKALDVADKRIREMPDNPSIYVQAVRICDRADDAKGFQKRLEEVFSRFSGNQSAMLNLANFSAQRGRPDLASECFNRALNYGFDRSVFALLMMEAHIRAGGHAEAIKSHNAMISIDRNVFGGEAPTSNVLLSAAKYGVGDAFSRNESERHLTAFLEKSKMAPTTCVASARLLRKVGAISFALRVLDAGARANPWSNAVRAEFVIARIADGKTEAYGELRPIADEIPEIAAGRLPGPDFWKAVDAWLRADTKLPAARREKLRALIDERLRPDLPGLVED